MIDYCQKEALKAEYTEVTYKHTNSGELTMLVYMPASKPSGCLMFIHGGGFNSDSAERLKRQAAYASRCGAVGVSVNYRLIDNNVSAVDALSDCADALEYIRRHVLSGYVNIPITVLGDSAGGYYACCLGCTKTLQRVRPNIRIADRIVDLNGIVDLSGKWNYALNGADVFYSREYSPLYNVTKNDAPVIIVHGDKDKTVPVSDSEEYCAALQNAGVQCELNVISGVSHAFILFDYKHDNELVASILKDVFIRLNELNLM